LNNNFKNHAEFLRITLVLDTPGQMIVCFSSWKFKDVFEKTWSTGFDMWEMVNNRDRECYWTRPKAASYLNMGWIVLLYVGLNKPSIKRARKRPFGTFSRSFSPLHLLSSELSYFLFFFSSWLTPTSFELNSGR